MNYICTGKQMQQIDRFSMDVISIPSAVLMERAALSAFEEMDRHIKDASDILFLVGAGNNGGDGLALSRMCFEAGYHVTVWLVGDHKRSGENENQLHIIEALNDQSNEQKIELCRIQTKEDIKTFAARRFDVIVDSLFGIGLTRTIASPELNVIEMANVQDAFRVSLDIPSGLDADNGQILNASFLADITVTFGYMKLGMLLGMGPDVCGEIFVKNIGIPHSAPYKTGVHTFTYDRYDLERLPARKAVSNKGSYGKVAVIAGCDTMAGAAYFSAAAAYRSGVGLVKVFSHSKNRNIILSKIPEALFEAYDEMHKEEVVRQAAAFGDVIVAGPGLGTSDMANRLVHDVLNQQDCPVILDADGLNILAEHKQWLNQSQTKVIVTPHLKEMERILKKPLSYIREHAVSEAQSFADFYGVTCVLKDVHTIVAGKSCGTYINTTGNHGMATGGTGDVLTGIIAAMVAQGLDMTEAARLGVLLHGMAGDASAANKSARGMLAEDMLDGIADVFLDMEHRR